MKYAIPSNFSLVFNATEIARRTEQLGEAIGEWALEAQKRTNADVLAVPLLRGAIFFFADIVRKIQTSIEVAPVRTWGYDPTTNKLDAAMQVNLADVAPEGRSILLVDDICDSGRSLNVVSKALLKAGAHEVKSVVLIRRKVRDPLHLPDWVGFEYAKDFWFVGYGMDDSDRWRNLPDIYVITQGQDR